MRLFVASLNRALTPQRLRQIWYIPSLAIAMVLMMVRLMIVARLLPVEEFATLSSGILVSGAFGMLGCLGLQSVLQRDWPMLLIRGQEYRGLVLAAQSNLVAVGCALVGLCVAASGVSIAGVKPIVFCIGVLHGLSQQFFSIATIESRSRGRMFDYARQNLLRGAIIVFLGLGAALLSRSGLLVLSVEAGITLTLSLGFFWKSTKRVVLGQMAIYRLAFNRFPQVKWRSAGMLTAVSVVGFLQMSLDRWFASDRLTPAIFAHYAFVCIVLSVGQSAQALINASAYPFVARRYAQHGVSAAYRICFLLSVALLATGALCLLPTLYFLRYAVQTWYIRYADVVGLLPLLLGVAVLRLSDFWTSFLAISHHETLLFKVNAWALLVAVAAFALYGWVMPEGANSLFGAGVLATLISVVPYVALSLAALKIERTARSGLNKP